MLEPSDLITLKKNGVKIEGVLEAAARHVEGNSAYVEPTRNAHTEMNVEQQWSQLNRISQIMALVDAAMHGDVQAAISWLQHPVETLSNQSPLEYAMTESGSKDVLCLLTGIIEDFYP